MLITETLCSATQCGELFEHRDFPLLMMLEQLCFTVFLPGSREYSFSPSERGLAGVMIALSGVFSVRCAGPGRAAAEVLHFYFSVG